MLNISKKIIICLMIPCCFSCTNSDERTWERAQQARNQKELHNIYDILKDYPALESVFTSGDLSKEEFESKLFNDFLGKPENADILIKLMKIAPTLFEKREIPENVFNSDVADNMRKGVLPDLISLTAKIMEITVNLPDDQKNMIYSFFDTIGGIEFNAIEHSETYYYFKDVAMNSAIFLNSEVIPEFVTNTDQQKRISDLLIILNETEFDTVDATEASIERIKEYAFSCFNYISSEDEETMNTIMQDLVSRLTEMRTPEEGKLDFEDIDLFIDQYFSEIPDITDFVVMLQSDTINNIVHEFKYLTYKPEFRNIAGDMIKGAGNFAADPAMKDVIKTSLTNINDNYDSRNLADIIERVWDKGPIVGDKVAQMGIENYGKDHKQNYTVKKLLGQTKYLNSTLQWISRLNDLGYKFDKFDDQFYNYIRDDPFCQPRDGAGEFGNGQFYQPENNFSYKNYSHLKGLVNLASRFDTPLTFTSPFLFENETNVNTLFDYKQYVDLVTDIIPTAASLPVTALLWVDIYEKSIYKDLGSGTKVRNKNGYGMLIPDLDAPGQNKYVAPVMPAIGSIAGLAAFMVAESIYNGPYDNIYDNFRWCLYERDYYCTIDLVQFMERVDPKYSEAKIMGEWSIKSLIQLWANDVGSPRCLPVVMFHSKGSQQILFLELGAMIDGMPAAIDTTLDQMIKINWANTASKAVMQAALPVLKTQLVTLLTRILPVGYPEGTNGKSKYILPKDLRDLWTMMNALCFYDKNAFHADRFLNRDNPLEYCLNYDIRSYTYAKDKDKINTAFPLVAACLVAGYEQYKTATAGIPISMDGIEAAQAAAKNEFGGVVFPSDYIGNAASALCEFPNDTPSYSFGDKELPLVDEIGRIVMNQNSGLIDGLFEMLCFLGKSENASNRTRILDLLKTTVDSVDPATTVPFDIAEFIINTTQKANENPNYWNLMNDTMDLTGEYLAETAEGNKVVDKLVLSMDPKFGIIDSFSSLMDHIKTIDAAELGLSDTLSVLSPVVVAVTENKLITRAMTDVTDILTILNSTKSWSDIWTLTDQGLKEDGIARYMINGLGKDPEYTWDEILFDTDKFMSSPAMMNFEEGSLWKDLFRLVDFMLAIFGQDGK